MTCPAILPRLSYCRRPTASPYGFPRFPSRSIVSYETKRHMPTRRARISADLVSAFDMIFRGVAAPRTPRHAHSLWSLASSLLCPRRSHGSDPVRVEIRPAIAQEQAPRVRTSGRGQIEIGVKNRVFERRRAPDHLASRRADERLAGERQAVLFADAIAESGVVAVLERRHAHLRLIEAVWPLTHRAGLRDDDEIRAGDRQCARVLGIVPVVTDRHTDSSRFRLVDGSAGGARRVVALLVEACVLGDVDHARAAEKTPVGVDHGRAIVCGRAVAFVQI